MTITTTALHINTQGATQFENITSKVQQAVAAAGCKNGIVTVFVKHTTAAVMIVEDEPGLRADTGVIWERLIPSDPAWRHNVINHNEDNAHSHLRAQIQGPSLTIPFSEGALALGTWQQVVLVDFDTRARTRELLIQVMGE
ncbi:MAG: secondary thiamine-phosphate synthase enzyme YjbQ [Burkholderiales bacterium]